MKNQRKKVRRKRWLQARAKAYRRVRFKTAFRNHFVNKGILSEVDEVRLEKSKSELQMEVEG